MSETSAPTFNLPDWYAARRAILVVVLNDTEITCKLPTAMQAAQIARRLRDVMAPESRERYGSYGAVDPKWLQPWPQMHMLMNKIDS